MAKHLVETLVGDALDEAVALCEGEDRPFGAKFGQDHPNRSMRGGWLCGRFTRAEVAARGRHFEAVLTNRYHRDWSKAGPLIEREGIRLERIDGPGHFSGDFVDGLRWLARHPSQPVNEMAREPLVAAMRALVAAKLGPEVELPDVTG